MLKLPLEPPLGPHICHASAMLTLESHSRALSDSKAFQDYIFHGDYDCTLAGASAKGCAKL